MAPPAARLPDRGRAGHGCRLPDRGRAGHDRHVPAGLPGNRGLVQRARRFCAVDPRRVVRRSRGGPAQPGHIVRPVRPQAAADRRDRDLHARLPGLRAGAIDPVAGRLPSARRDRCVGRHGDPARDGPRSGRGPRRGSAAVTAVAGDGGRADPRASHRQRGAGLRRLARHLLDPHRIRRCMLDTCGAAVARHAARGAAHPAASRRAVGRYRGILAERGFLTHAVDGRLRDVRVLRLSRRLVAGVHPGLRPDAGALRDDLRRKLVRPDLLRAAQSASAASFRALPRAALGQPRPSGRDGNADGDRVRRAGTRCRWSSRRCSWR